MMSRYGDRFFLLCFSDPWKRRLKGQRSGSNSLVKKLVLLIISLLMRKIVTERLIWLLIQTVRLWIDYWLLSKNLLTQLQASIFILFQVLGSLENLVIAMTPRTTVKIPSIGLFENVYYCMVISETLCEEIVGVKFLN